MWDENGAHPLRKRGGGGWGTRRAVKAVQAREAPEKGSKMAKSAAIESVGDSKLDTLKAWPQRAKSFYNDVRTEMRKVTTPSRKEVQGTTTVVIITVFLFGLFFWIVDTVIGSGLDHLLKYLAR
jgi:preprotein translocase subunit SecE